MPYLLGYVFIKNSITQVFYWSMLISPSPLNAPFLDPQKTSENREVFHGVEKRCIGYNLEFRKTEMLSFINNSGQTNLMDINDVIIF